MKETRTAPLSPTDHPGRPCSVAAGLQIVGDRWALLVVRELLFGNHRFDQIARNTGGPRDRIAARLRDLESVGVIERRRYSEHPPRFEYHLTDAGRDLAPVVQALRVWGDTWAVGQPTMTVRHSCGRELKTVTTCRDCGQPVHESAMSFEVTAPGWDLSGPLA